MTIGDILLRLRTEKDVPMRVVASKAGVSLVHICYMENNKSKASMHTLQRLADYYGTTIHEIFCEYAGSTEPKVVFDALINYLKEPSESWIKQKIKSIKKVS